MPATVLSSLKVYSNYFPSNNNSLQVLAIDVPVGEMFNKDVEISVLH